MKRRAKELEMARREERKTGRKAYTGTEYNIPV